MLIFQLLIVNEQESSYRKTHPPKVSTMAQSSPSLSDDQIVQRREDWVIKVVNFVLILKHGGKYQI